MTISWIILVFSWMVRRQRKKEEKKKAFFIMCSGSRGKDTLDEAGTSVFSTKKIY